MYHHALTAALAAAAATMVASLPDPTQPTIILLLAGVGALIGAAIGRVRRLPRSRIREIAENWSFAFSVIGAALYALTTLTGIL